MGNIVSIDLSIFMKYCNSQAIYKRRVMERTEYIECFCKYGKNVMGNISPIKSK